MRKILTLLSLCSLIVQFSCTGTSGVDVTEHFDASPHYYRLEISDGMIVTVTDEVNDIVITADENVMEKIEVKHSSGTLRIYRRDFSVTYITTAKVLIPYNPDLRQVKVTYDSEFHGDLDYGIQADEVKVIVDARSKFYSYICAHELDLDITDYSFADISFDVYDNIDLKIEDHSDADLDGYSNTVHLVMNDHSSLKKHWNDDFYAFMCDVCWGSMNDNCEAYIDSEGEIRMSLTNNSFLYYTSNPYIGESTIDATSDFIYGGY